MIGHIGSVEGQPLSGEGIESVVKRLLVGPADGWQGWALRLFELAPGGHTPRHRHPWPHVDYITAGHGTLHVDGADNPVETGSFAYVPAGAHAPVQQRGRRHVRLPVHRARRGRELRGCPARKSAEASAAASARRSPRARLARLLEELVEREGLEQVDDLLPDLGEHGRLAASRHGAQDQARGLAHLDLGEAARAHRR